MRGCAFMTGGSSFYGQAAHSSVQTLVQRCQSGITFLCISVISNILKAGQQHAVHEF